MHSLQDVMANLLNDRKGLCQAVEKAGTICFNKSSRKSKYCPKHQYRVTKYGICDLPKKEIKICRFIDCNNRARGKGLCAIHYHQKFMKDVKEGRAGLKTKCIINGCGNYQIVKGYCDMHYHRQYRHGDPFTNNMNKCKPPNNKGRRKHKCCIVEGCENKDSSVVKITKGLCWKHYKRWRKFKDYNIESKKEYLLKQQDNK